jgi:hypothetical protein
MAEPEVCRDAEELARSALQSADESALKITVELDDATPNCIGSYRILHKIGAGRMGTVYAALGSRLGHGVLQIELLHPTTAASPTVIFTRFKR